MNDNVRPVFILRRKKPQPTYKKFHAIQVKSKVYIPLAHVNREEASCTDIFFSPPPKYYYFLYSWTHKSNDAEGDQRCIIQPSLSLIMSWPRYLRRTVRNGVHPEGSSSWKPLAISGKMAESHVASFGRFASRLSEYIYIFRLLEILQQWVPNVIMP